MRRFIAQSYGNCNYERTGSGPKTEGDPFDPTPPAKQTQFLAAIRHLECAVLGADGIEGLALRYGNFYGLGNGISVHGEIAAQVRKRRLPIIGDGGGMWSFVPIDRAAAAAVAAIAGKSCVERTWHVPRRSAQIAVSAPSTARVAWRRSPARSVARSFGRGYGFQPSRAILPSTPARRPWWPIRAPRAIPTSVSRATFLAVGLMPWLPRETAGRGPARVLAGASPDESAEAQIVSSALEAAKPDGG